MKFHFLLIFTQLFLSTNTFPQVFDNRVDLGLIEYNPIDEASGIVASRKNTDVLWTHNDSGDPNRIFGLNSQGEHLGVYTINGANARDWEDIAVGPGPTAGENYIYIANIGDNSVQYNTKYIYRVLEPDVSSNQSPVNTTLTNVETIAFQYPDGRRDAETIMIDPLNKDIYIVSKREQNVRVYRLAYPQSITQTIMAVHVATLDLTGGQSGALGRIVGGDISHTGHEILIKTRVKIYYWPRNAAENLLEAFAESPVILPYIEEPQGEAVAWSPDARGNYTVSEEPGGTPAHLYFYPRIDDPFPVELSFFTARLTDNIVVLEWSTESEINNYGFDVERSIKNDDWQKIGFVPGSGNSNSTNNYSFIDDDIPNANVLNYRLKQIDNDGSHEYSDEVLVRNPATSAFVLHQNYPNPFNPATKLNFTISEQSFVTLKVFDTLGNEIATLVNERLDSGAYEISFDAVNFKSGVYFYSLKTEKFVQTKKMTLIK
jgi:hypothetical protein